MARRPSRLIAQPDELLDDPLDQAVRDDRQNAADQLALALEALGAVDQATIKGILYKIPVPNGKYEWIRDVFPPFDLSEIMRSLKEEVGGGDYALRLMAENKVRRTVHFSIMRDRQDNSGLVKPRDGVGELLPLILQMATQSSDRQMQMMMTMSSQAQAASAQQTQMMVAMITAMMGSQGKPTDLLPLIAAMREGQDKGGGMKEAIETLAAAKGLFGDSGGGLDADDLVGSALKLAGPVAGAIGRAVQARQEQAQLPPPADYQVEPAPGGALMLPGADPGQPVGLPANPAPIRHPIIELVREDVTFMFRRGYDPETAAELVLDRLEASGVSEEQVGGLVAQIAVEPDPWAALAGYGVDLRANLLWGEQFLQALARLHADPGGYDDDTAGGTGDQADVALDGSPSTRGVAADRD